MLVRTLFLVTIASYWQVQCYVPVPSIYKKGEMALRRYSSNTDSSPVIHSLLNVLVYDKRAIAFITSKAIEQSLNDVKKYNEKDAAILRRLIYGTRILSPSGERSPDMEQDIESALDTFFTHPDVDDEQAFRVMSQKKGLHSLE